MFRNAWKLQFQIYSEINQNKFKSRYNAMETRCSLFVLVYFRPTASRQHLPEIVNDGQRKLQSLCPRTKRYFTEFTGPRISLHFRNVTCAVHDVADFSDNKLLSNSSPASLPALFVCPNIHHICCAEAKTCKN